MFINMPAFLQLELIFGFGMFFVILGVIIFHSAKNNKKPKLSVNATVVAKRKIGRGRRVSDTHYFVTFQVDTGDRIELLIPSFDYSEFKQDDYGKLTFQGTRFLGFEKDEYLSSVPKGLRVLDVISWLPVEEISQKELEDIFMGYMNGLETEGYKVSRTMPQNVTDNVLDADFYLTEEGRKTAFIIRDDSVIAVIGYKE